MTGTLRRLKTFRYTSCDQMRLVLSFFFATCPLSIVHPYLSWIVIDEDLQDEWLYQLCPGGSSRRSTAFFILALVFLGPKNPTWIYVAFLKWGIPQSPWVSIPKWSISGWFGVPFEAAPGFLGECRTTEASGSVPPSLQANGMMILNDQWKWGFETTKRDFKLLLYPTFKKINPDDSHSY